MDVNRITLECLVNPTLYNKYLKKNEKENENNEFYKKRIIDLTNKLFENKTENNALNKAFDNYIYECISYLYVSDMNKTYQRKLLILVATFYKYFGPLSLILVLIPAPSSGEF